MSIYSQLLTAAIASGERPRTASDEEQLVADLARCRAHLPHGQLPASSAGGVPAAVAGQLAYDLALTALCRHAGVAFEVAEFDRPVAARARLEHALISRGLRRPDGGPSRGGLTL